MKILTAAEMSATDRRSSEEFGIPLTDLMEHAGAAVAAFCLRQYPSATKITALCGKGNNGGDGFVAARLLGQTGRNVTVLLLGQISKLKGEAASAFAHLRTETAVHILEMDDEPALADALKHTDLLIDAVVGTGFRPPLRGLAAAAQNILAQSNVPIVAIDLPSGWDADSTEQTSAEAFRADAVVTFTAPKLAHVFGHLTQRTFGPVVVAEIGSPTQAVQSTSHLTWAGTSKAIAEQPRNANSNKGNFGHVLLIGGSYGKAGAPSMSSLAALRAGAGLVTAAVPESILNTVALTTPELMMAPLLESDGAVALANLENGNLDKLLKGIKVLAVGPGLSTDGEAPEFVRRLVAQTTLPIVIDADALNAFAGHTDLLRGNGRAMVLTPHPGEMARLLGKTVKEVEADRLNLARAFSTKHHLTLVLKGWRTLIAHPDGTVAINTTGNPAMAKGGSGDILTGIVAAMLAQFPNDVARAVETAVYLHGLAADFAAHAMDEHTVLATDTLAHLTNAFRYRIKDADGLTWLTGIHS
ncbi:NAD(P)H-hydrate dehydratase [Granulicella arctica]|uniref:Bifunctional NAD(P)H-hydrate repair enzyme n=1 Tax=Granulicella arctica TaxID=940613 RepID=A0A7Y9PJV5_9BACT|nr:NAD(P)H-hydrate dehydratase [Granulicella arctica]NYF81182.1 NAD(P)H-hydrate epimerase [Granulicella arctica]